MHKILSDRKPILIAGPTASGKSSLAIEIAQKTNGAIINADALQVYEGWNILTARPSKHDLLECQHYMYGHVAMDQAYSVGAWMRDIKQHLQQCKDTGQRPIIVGGTGLYFSSLTRGLAKIPEIPSDIRQKADHMRENMGREIFAGLLAKSDPDTYALIDVQNPVRTQRAWEVLTATGKGLSKWQKSPQKPLIPEIDAHLILMVSDTSWINARIDQRFDLMIDQGALEECQIAMNTWWNEDLPSCKAIGAKELISYLNNNLELTEAIEIAKTNSRRYAKKQRTWFRTRMQMWQKLDISDSNIDLSSAI